MISHIKSLEQLEDLLTQDLAWRKAEIMKLKVEISNINSAEKIINFRLRSAIVLLYADWEGFIRNAANYYVVYVFDKKIPLSQLSRGFWTIDLYEQFTKVFKSKKKVVQQDFLNELFDHLESNEHIRYVDKSEKRFINTDSNLNFRLFQEIVSIIGIEDNFDLAKNMIDKNLLSVRNAIAHGEKRALSKDEIIELLDYFMKEMEKFKISIFNSAESNLFLR